MRRDLRDEGGAPPRYGPRPERPSKPDPHKAYLRRRVTAAHPRWIPATVLLGEIRARGSGGGLSILKDDRRPLRPRRRPEPLVRFETAPGEPRPAGRGTLRRGRPRLSAFIATPGHSRATFVELGEDERLETLLACHEHAFFGGVPGEVPDDNRKAVVLARDAYGAGRHRFHPTFRDCAHHHGFRPRLCRPYRAKTKGKVERLVGSLKGSVFVPLDSRLRAGGILVDAATATGLPALARRGGQHPGARHHRPGAGGGAG